MCAHHEWGDELLLPRVDRCNHVGLAEKLAGWTSKEKENKVKVIKERLLAS